MYVDAHACMYMYMYVHMYTYIYADVYVFVRVRARTYAAWEVYLVDVVFNQAETSTQALLRRLPRKGRNRVLDMQRRNIYKHACSCMYLYVYTYLHICIHTCIITYTCVYIHLHVYTYVYVDKYTVNVCTYLVSCVYTYD